MKEIDKITKLLTNLGYERFFENKEKNGELYFTDAPEEMNRMIVVNESSTIKLVVRDLMDAGHQKEDINKFL